LGLRGTWGPLDPRAKLTLPYPARIHWRGPWLVDRLATLESVQARKILANSGEPKPGKVRLALTRKTRQS